MKGTDDLVRALAAHTGAPLFMARPVMIEARRMVALALHHQREVHWARFGRFYLTQRKSGRLVARFKAYGSLRRRVLQGTPLPPPTTRPRGDRVRRRAPTLATERETIAAMPPVVTLADMARLVAQRTGFPIGRVRALLTAAPLVIADALVVGDEVRWHGVGRFYVRHLPVRVIPHPTLEGVQATIGGLSVSLDASATLSPKEEHHVV